MAIRVLRHFGFSRLSALTGADNREGLCGPVNDDRIPPMTAEDMRLSDILGFWHKLEFFIPFDLDNRIRERENRKRIWRHYNESGPITFIDISDGKEISGYTVFLGVFDKADIRDIVDGRLSRTDDEALEEEQRGGLEGLTCMASIELGADAVPLFETFSISTLPWAVGRARSHGLSALHSGAFNDARELLRRKLENVANLRPTLPADDETHGRKPPLAPQEVDELVGLLADWSGFRPDEARHPAALLEVRFRKKRSAPSRPEETATANPGATEDEAEEDAGPVEIGILNSFFIEDIERAMAAVAAGRAPETLRQYLTPISAHERIDLYSGEGRARIVKALSPSRQNRGRWFSDPAHAMSLMQQFAINTALERIGDAAGLFSVNGPPGTGKTTLLRDLIAENITRRARVLAKLGKPSDAFHKSGAYARLIPELTGFEMVVASSNNAAVENISRDLPKARSVWDSESKSIRYLQPVAHKFAAQDRDGRCKELSDADMPWGLIACALGKATNRSAFVNSVFWNRIAPDARKTWSGPERPLTFWEWRDERAGKTDGSKTDGIASFRDAQAAFLSAKEEIDRVLDKMQKFEDLRALMAGHTRETWCEEERRKLDRAGENRAAADAALTRAEKELEETRGKLGELQELAALLEKTRPSWWEKLLGTPSARQYRKNVSQNAGEQIVERQTISRIAAEIAKTLEPARNKAETLAAAVEAEVAKAEAGWNEMCRELAEGRARYGKVSPPDNLDDLETGNIQKNGFWHDEDLAEQRSDLFRKALQLHEAWLLAVSRKGGGFGPNIVAVQELLKNKLDCEPEERLAILQSLFMIVPVVSSTFSSFARQFGEMGPESIGWLFIDEAGQAVPQAATGALLRAKRAVVIGDPLQIEPVFTLPKRLISDLAGQSPHTAGGDYSPDSASVQMLADRCNPYGTEAGGEGDKGIWIGSPLRVHRRCLDPMFSIANRIAYDDRMIFGLDNRLDPVDQAPFFGDSVWIDLPGAVAGRQTVPAQIDFVARLIADAIAHYDELPKLYVISPFKEVKSSLAARLQDKSLWDSMSAPGLRGKEFRDWLSSRIGTVHTFQGKEEDAVIMLLGADENTQGAVRWAASKPNLLNVALTRAKRRFYMVGDRTLWQGQPYFREAAQNLPHLTENEFLNRIKQLRADQRNGEIHPD
ncbi:MAG: DEAD/DEAH box helicase [Pseudochelatococcus sp.]|uniref:DEAD/DEAH box helicase n=1 Tax=Pseudochelatococcus sp. TaxID=2020869 RepID=UPI003D8BA142